LDAFYEHEESKIRKLLIKLLNAANFATEQQEKESSELVDINKKSGIRGIRSKSVKIDHYKINDIV